MRRGAGGLPTIETMPHVDVFASACECDLYLSFAIQTCSLFHLLVTSQQGISSGFGYELREFFKGNYKEMLHSLGSLLLSLRTSKPRFVLQAGKTLESL